MYKKNTFCQLFQTDLKAVYLKNGKVIGYKDREGLHYVNQYKKH